MTLRDSRAIIGALSTALALAACAAGGEHKSHCLDHYQTEFGNQTRWVSCPAAHPDSPWKQGGR